MSSYLSQVVAQMWYFASGVVCLSGRSGVVELWSVAWDRGSIGI